MPSNKEKGSKYIEDYRELYGDAVEQVYDEILEKDRIFDVNDPLMMDLKEAAMDLKAEFEKKTPNPEAMDMKLKQFFDAAKACRQEAEPEKKSEEKEQFLDAVDNFEKIYESNELGETKTQYVDFSECKGRALGIAGEPAEKKEKQEDPEKEAADGLSELDSAKRRIKEVEESGLNKIENALKNYSTEELMQGLCEVIASRSVKAHADNVKPQDIQRSLSPECISRVRNHFGKKLQAALKDIDKDDFIEIMDSGDIGNKMVSKVSGNLIENEKKVMPEKQAAAEMMKGAKKMDELSLS